MNLNHSTKGFSKTSEVAIPDSFFNRIVTGVENIDNIFGSGIMPGSTITLTAPGGVGKSVFCLTLAEMLTNKGYNVRYTSGEESATQIAYNCKRLNVVNLEIGNITDVETLLEEMVGLDLIIIDSFQSLTSNIGSKLVHYINSIVKKAKDTGCAVIFIVQVNVDGSMKGGTTLSHAVDVNIKLDKNLVVGESHRLFNTYKNRFGATRYTSAIMEQGGYNFLGVWEAPSKTKTKKLSLADQRKNAILELTGCFTIFHVTNRLKVSKSIALGVLSEMEFEKLIIKYGEGDLTAWKVGNPDDQGLLSKGVNLFAKYLILANSKPKK